MTAPAPHRALRRFLAEGGNSRSLAAALRFCAALVWVRRGMNAPAHIEEMRRALRLYRAHGAADGDGDADLEAAMAEEFRKEEEKHGG